jgi:hypothetical protein
MTAEATRKEKPTKRTQLSAKENMTREKPSTEESQTI